jgi:hypothetical protein
VPSEESGEAREIPLRSRAESHAEPGLFVAVDEEGRLWYGTDLGLWGPPVDGFTGGIVSFGEGFLAACESRPGEASLVLLTIGASRALETTGTIPLGPYTIDALVNVDLGGDGVLDVVAARRTATGSRLICLKQDSRE